MEKIYENIGNRLLKKIKDEFDDSYFDDEEVFVEYKILRLPLNLSLRFQSWAGKPYYIILFKGNKCLYELDLSRIIKTKNKFTWYLNVPTHSLNKDVLDNNYLFNAKINDKYIENVRKVKKLLNSGVRITSSGYEFCINEDFNSLSSMTNDLITLIISTHSNINLKNKNEIFEFDSNEALEGYEFDQIIKLRKRDKKIIKDRKKLDNYTCQSCGLYLEVNGNYIIDCHHVNPIEYGVRKTELDHLACLCPTCHRIAHQKRMPYTVEEIQKIIKISHNQHQTTRKTARLSKTLTNF